MPPKSESTRKSQTSKSQTRRNTSGKQPSGGKESSSSAPASDDSAESKKPSTKKSEAARKSDVRSQKRKSEAQKPSASTSKAVQKSATKPVSVVNPPRPPTPQEESSSEGIADELGIKKGVLIPEKDGNFVVVRVLGEGGFGAVLEVFREGKEDQQHYAMKVEKRGRKNEKLKMEEIKTAREKGLLLDHANGPHFTDLFGRGKMGTYVFLVMELVGKSLSDLKADYPKKVFSPGSGIFAAMQCLEAVQDLHFLKFIHRDLKPANYAIGVATKIRTVYILDFGISRRTVNGRNEMKTPRAFVGFKGTVRFASRRCHKNQELGYSDDCESWFYLLLDLVVEEGLPWKRLDDKNKVFEMKEKCMNTRSFFPSALKYHRHFTQIADYIAVLQYESLLDYKFIYDCLVDAAKCCGVEDLKTHKLDWEN